MVNERSERLISLDVLRGLAVVGMILVNSMGRVHKRADAEVFPMLLHSPWNGLTIADVMFPAFLMMVGVSIPLAFRDSKLDRDQVVRILWRGARLVLLGLILVNFSRFREFAPDIRFYGVLQRIGIVYVVCSVLFLTCGPRARLGLILATLMLYWPLVLLPALDGLPTDIMTPGHNYAASVDRYLFGAGAHNYVDGPAGYDPEGLLGTLPAIAAGLIGVAIGERFRARKQASQALPLAALGGVMLSVGLIWSLAFPIIMDVWTSSYVLVTCGITTLVLAGLHAWLDRPGSETGLNRPFTTFFVAFGINAITAYALHGITAGMFGWDLLMAPFEAIRAAIGDPVAAFVPVLFYIGLIWLVVEYLRRRRWIIRI